MSTVMPQSELQRRAISWIDGEKRERPQKKLHALVDEAGMRFNLSPQDCEFLLGFFAGTEEAKKADEA